MPYVAPFVRTPRPCTSAVLPLGLSIAAAIAVLMPATAAAEPLPPDTCEALIQERALLEGGGAGENIERGVAWGKSNLTPEQLEYIKRLIAVREAVTFRCRSYDVVREPSPPSPATAQSAAPAADGKSVATTTPAVKKTPAQKEAAPVPPPARKRAAEASAPATAKAALPSVNEPKPAAKKPAKTSKSDVNPRPAKNDAYVPPEGAESTMKVPAGVAPQPQPQ